MQVHNCVDISMDVRFSPLMEWESVAALDMLIGQWVDKDSTIRLNNEPQLWRSAACEERATVRRRSRREITQYVCVFVSFVFGCFRQVKGCVGVPVWTCTLSKAVVRVSLGWKPPTGEASLQNVSFILQGRKPMFHSHNNDIFTFPAGFRKRFIGPRAEGAETLTRLLEDQVVLLVI